MTDRRVLAAITGAVSDEPGPLAEETSSVALPERLVFLDADDNGQLDPGEPISLTDGEGVFRFDEVGDGPYVVRLFDGTSTQTPTYPLRGEASGVTIPLSDPLQTISSDAGAWTLTRDALLVSDLVSGVSQPIEFGVELRKMATLPDGRLLVVGGDETSAEAWLVDPSVREAVAIQLTDHVAGEAWSDVAVGGEGHGVLMMRTSEGTSVYHLDATFTETSVPEATDTGVVIPVDASVLASESGPRSVIAWPSEGGIDAALWSNPTGTAITDPPVSIPGVTGLVAFDDASGLLVARMASGGVTVLDVNGGFASLHEFDASIGPVALDGERELLITAPSASGPDSGSGPVRVIDLVDGETLARFPIELGAYGEPVELFAADDLDSLLLVGSSGMGRVSLRAVSEHRVVVASGETPAAIRFGVRVEGENTPPSYSSVPSWNTLEGVTLQVDAPDGLAGASDAEGNTVVLVQVGAAGQGTATVTTTGEISYAPNPGFVGTDTIPVMLHDGRAGTAVDLEITVTPAPDPITGISPAEGTVPENASGDVIAELVVEGREDEHTFFEITTDDPRFVIEFGELRLADGVALDYEREPEVVIELTATDLVYGDSYSQEFVVLVIDVAERPQAIELANDTVTELRPGDEVGAVLVDEIVPNGGVTLTVDDPRFEIVSGTLKLADGVWVDRVDQTEIQLEITAQDFGQVFEPSVATFVIEVLENATPYHNEELPYDVNGDGVVTALDALLIVNYLNTYGPGPVGYGDPGFGYDVNSDGSVTSLDALLVVNELNRRGQNGGTTSGEGGSGEGESVEGERLADDVPSPAEPRRLELAGPSRNPGAADEALRMFTSGRPTGQEPEDRTRDWSWRADPDETVSGDLARDSGWWIPAERVSSAGAERVDSAGDATPQPDADLASGQVSGALGDDSGERLGPTVRLQSGRRS